MTRQLPSLFEIGDKVRVADGPFGSFRGVVWEVEQASQQLKVVVNTYGRPIQFALEFGQVKGL